MVKTIKNQAKMKVPGLIKAISIIDYIYGTLIIIGAIILFLGGISLYPSDIFTRMMPMFTGVARGLIIFTSLIMLAIGILYIYLGKAITQYKLWAKILQIILGILGLFSFPIGTAIGIFVIWALLINKNIKNLFR